MKNNSRKDKKKREVIEKYNITSHFYEERYFKIQNEKFLLICENFELDEQIILDAGCGTGLFYEFISKRDNLQEISNFQYVGVDISLNMLKLFKSKFILIEKRVNLILSDLEYLPIRKNTFHHGFSITSLQNLPDMIEGFLELFRVMKKEGNISISILKKNLDERQIRSIIKSHIGEIRILDKREIEDIIFIGRLKDVEER